MKSVGDSINDSLNMKEGANDLLVVCFGEMLIDFVPTLCGVSLAEAPSFKTAPGGAPANVAVGISRLGGSSAFIGKVHLDTVLGYLFMKCLIVAHAKHG